jgi:hypothetical protein
MECGFAVLRMATDMVKLDMYTVAAAMVPETGRMNNTPHC